MPDPDRRSVSASEAAALFGLSPYTTRYMLYRKLAHGVVLDKPEDGRMSWGKKVEPLIVAQAALDMNLEVFPNQPPRYVRAGLLGCTRDADIYDPAVGPGALECKSVWDYSVWMTRWNGGERLPADIMIQVQTQMLVGDGESPFGWGLVAALVCGESKYWRVAPDPQLWKRLTEGAAQLFADIEEGNEPRADGLAIEEPWIKEQWPEIIRPEQDLQGDPEAAAYAEVARMYAHADAASKRFAKAAKDYKAKLLGLAADCEVTRLPAVTLYQSRSNRKERKCDCGATIQKASQSVSIKVDVDEEAVANTQEQEIFG